MSAVRARVLLVLWLMLLVTAGFAQNPAENMLLSLMPELRGMPAPDWLQEGTRVTYHSASATLPAERFYWYKNKDDAWSRAEEVGPAGAALTQYICVYRSANGAVGTLDNYVIDINTGQLSHHPMGGCVDPAGAGACWANPAALANADRFQSLNTRVYKMPHAVGDRVYSAVRFRYITETALDETVFDLESGLLLFHQHVSLSTDGRYTLMTQMNFVALRQAPPAVAGAAAPSWSAEARLMQYQGSFAAQVPGSPVMPIPVFAAMEKIDGGARWGRYRVTRQLQGQTPDATDVFVGAGGIAGEPWMAPALLQKLTPGQVLDQDPHLGVITAVEQIAPAPNGIEVVVISREGNGFKRSHAYDRASGMMLMVTALQQVGVSVHQTQFQLVQ